MSRLVPAGVILFVLFSATCASAALPPAYYNPSGSSQSCTAAQPCGTQGKTITFYVPHGGTDCASSLQGCIATSRVGLDGTNEPIPVDAVRLGKAQYATCASDPSNYGKYFNMGTITYRSALDQQMYTVQNVICYVHDTGGAFQGRPDKLDLATTICPTCTEAQASAIGRGGQVNVAGQGPVDANRNTSIFNSALANIGATPVGYQSGAGIGQNSSQNYGGNQPFANAPLQQPVTPFSQAATSLATPSQSQSSSQSLQNMQSGTSSAVALLVAQPSSVRHGDPVLVAWTSVGMDPQSLCQVSENGQAITQKNSGSQIRPTTLSQVGTLTFTLLCTTSAGVQIQQTDAVSVI